MAAIFSTVVQQSLTKIAASSVFTLPQCAQLHWLAGNSDIFAQHKKCRQKSMRQAVPVHQGSQEGQAVVSYFGNTLRIKVPYTIIYCNFSSTFMECGGSAYNA